MNSSHPMRSAQIDAIRAISRLLVPFRGRIEFLLLLAIGSALANGLVPLATGKFLDSLVRAGGTLDDAFQMLGLWIAIQFVAHISDSLGDRQSRRLSADISLRISTESLAHLLRLPIAYHKRVAINGDLRKITEASSFVSQTVRVATNVLPQLLSVVIGICMAIVISPPLSAILVAATLAYSMILRRTFRSAAAKDLKARDEFVDGWARATAAVNLVDIVKQATAEDHEIHALRETFLTKLRRSWHMLEDRWNQASSVQKAVTFVCQIAIFAIATYQVRAGLLTVGELVAFIGYTMMLLGPLASLGHSWETIQHGLTSAHQLDSILSSEEERYHPAASDSPTAPIGEIEFEKVTFSYGSGQNDALSGLSFRIEAGSLVAIVGHSGAGKSTLVSLLSGYYFPTKGRVLIGGVDTRRFDLVDLRRQIAVVPQDVVLFNSSIRENVLYGAFDASDERFLSAVRIARVDEFAENFPRGYDTIVGERGTMLSVGQKQRIAIARAILRDPSIFVFDEPTSALDSQTEKLVADALEAAIEGRTAFVVAHRLSTVRRANLILVFDKGRLCEAGDHNSLVQVEGGIYRNFYECHVGVG